jgi:hypothetical protein
MRKFYFFLLKKEPEVENMIIIRCHQKSFIFLAQHVAIFEQDLCQLIKELKEFIFPDIYDGIDYEKVEPYRLMVQAHFPYVRSDVEISRFCLWLQFPVCYMQ